MLRFIHYLQEIIITRLSSLLPKDIPITQRRDYQQVLILAMAALALTIPNIALYVFWQHPLARLGLTMGFGTIIHYSLAIVFIRKSQLTLALNTLMLWTLVSIGCSAIMFGKGMKIHLYLNLYAVGAMIAYPKRYQRTALMMVALGLLMSLAIEVFVSELPLFGSPIESSVLYFSHINTIVWLYLCISGYILWTKRSLETLSQKLEFEKQKSENLLRQILPEPIAVRLLNGEKTIADSHDQVSVLFADIVNFTSLAEKIGPRKTVELLNSLFSDFDRLTEKFHLEKIKTIGDAYMAASGLQGSMEQHASLLFQLGLAMLKHVEQQNILDGHKLAIRIGINSGTVVAGVIGTHKYAYDLWGDTVNLASRLESKGVAGTIQISHSSFLLLKDQYRFESRGFIELKGKGAVPVWIYDPAVQDEQASASA